MGTDCTPEGVSTLIPHKGSVTALVAELEGGIRSALSYCNSASIADLHEQTIEFVKVTSASQRENGPHALSLSPEGVGAAAGDPAAENS